MSEMCVLSKEGDTKLIWDPDNEDEVSAARVMFDDLRGKGFMAYSVRGRRGDKGDVLREFDPTAEKLILAPPMVGG